MLFSFAKLRENWHRDDGILLWDIIIIIIIVIIINFMQGMYKYTWHKPCF
jgi:hypothetical protein